MNKKITVCSKDGQIRYCILSGEKDLEAQFNNWYFGSDHPSNGFCVYFYDTSLAVADYYHNEERASFDVISIEDTNEEIVLEWTDPETKKRAGLDPKRKSGVQITPLFLCIGHLGKYYPIMLSSVHKPRK